MDVKRILKNNAHRPWPMPEGSWKYYQEWNRVLFLHWKVDFDQLRVLVPAGLEIDQHGGTPWVSLVAFTMENVRPRYLPALKPISNFDEINLRTYVKRGDKAGVYFLSIEAGNPVSCGIAQRLSGLPYRYSKMRRTAQAYQSSNRITQDHLAMEYAIGEEMSSKTGLDQWLTERYALFQEFRGGINQYEIHHLEWPLNKLHIARLQIDYPKFAGLINKQPDVAHYSDGVQVVAWPGQQYTKK